MKKQSVDMISDALLKDRLISEHSDVLVFIRDGKPVHIKANNLKEKPIEIPL